MKDDAGSGSTSTARTDENVESVRRLLTEVRRTTLQMIADGLNIGKGDSSLDCNRRLGKNKDLREICSSPLDHRAGTRSCCLLPRSSFNGTRWMFWGKYHYR